MKADVIEAEAFLYKYAEVEAVDLLIADSNGILRGKRVRRDALNKVYTQGIALPGSVFAATITGDTAEQTGLGFSEGDADRLCWPVSGSLCLTPWQPRPMAQLLLAMYELDDTPFYADPRHMLARVIERFEALALIPVVAFELEFYIFDHSSDGAQPRAPRAPGNAYRESQTQVYGIRELEIFDALLEDIVQTAASQDLPVDSLVSENAPGQYEVNLKHQTDPFAACDHALLLKRLIKALAEKHGYGATFMAKPYNDWVGSGMHAHISLQNGNGENAFASPQPLDNPLLRQAAAGLALTMPEAMALFAPNVNSYRRFQPESYVPLSPTWGYNNRTLALRVPTGAADDRRLEHRVAGADANPYLVLAALLAGIHHGISQRLEPPPAVTGNAYELAPETAPPLPITWPQALAALRQATVLPDYLGEAFCNTYITTKSAELSAFERQVTPLEHAWYLSAV